MLKRILLILFSIFLFSLSTAKTVDKYDNFPWANITEYDQDSIISLLSKEISASKSDLSISLFKKRTQIKKILAEPPEKSVADKALDSFRSFSWKIYTNFGKKIEPSYSARKALSNFNEFFAVIIQIFPYISVSAIIIGILLIRLVENETVFRASLIFLLLNIISYIAYKTFEGLSVRPVYTVTLICLVFLLIISIFASYVFSCIISESLLSDGSYIIFIFISLLLLQLILIIYPKDSNEFNTKDVENTLKLYSLLSPKIKNADAGYFYVERNNGVKPIKIDMDDNSIIKTVIAYSVYYKNIKEIESKLYFSINSVAKDISTRNSFAKNNSGLVDKDALQVAKIRISRMDEKIRAKVNSLKEYNSLATRQESLFIAFGEKLIQIIDFSHLERSWGKSVNSADNSNSPDYPDLDFNGADIEAALMEKLAKIGEKIEAEAL